MHTDSHLQRWVMNREPWGLTLCICVAHNRPYSFLTMGQDGGRTCKLLSRRLTWPITSWSGARGPVLPLLLLSLDYCCWLFGCCCAHCSPPAAQRLDLVSLSLLSLYSVSLGIHTAIQMYCIGKLESSINLICMLGMREEAQLPRKKLQGDGITFERHNLNPKPQNCQKNLKVASRFWPNPFPSWQWLGTIIKLMKSLRNIHWNKYYES